VKEISDNFTVLRDGRSVGAGRTRTHGQTRSSKLMVGRDVEDLYPRSARSAGDELLKFNGLAGRGKPQLASLSLRRGEVVGIAG